MKIAIIASAKDPAGMKIIQNLLKLKKFPARIGEHDVNIFQREEGIVHLENIDGEIEADIFVFASKHVSRAGIHSLTVHSLGNWNKAEAGGIERKIVPAPAALMKLCLKLLDDKAKDVHYEVIQEATHHGPFLRKPAMFIEIGCSEKSWTDLTAGRIVADVIIEAIQSYNCENGENALGIGGMHHCPNFRKIMLSSDESVSHVCPKHMLEFLDDEMIKEAMEKSGAKKIVLDWKGLGKEKERIVKLISEMGIEFRRTKDY